MPQYSSSSQWQFDLWGSLLYVVTGILQPIIVDWLRLHNALGRHGLLLPTWANTLGMAACGLFASKHDWTIAKQCIFFQKHSTTTSNNAKPLNTTSTASNFLRRRLYWTASIDLISGMLLSGGLLWTGGSIFVVLYNSVPVWTALQARCGLGQVLNRGQILGVLLVSIGLASQVLSSGEEELSTSSSSNQDHGIIDSFNTINQQESLYRINNHKIIIGSSMVLLGSFLHGTMFILTESTLSLSTTKKPIMERNCDDGGEEGNNKIISSQIWCSMMGCLEVCFMSIWVLTGSVIWGYHNNELDENDSTTTAQSNSHTGSGDVAAAVTAPAAFPPSVSIVVCGLASLVLVDVVHAAAFFTLLQHIGAIGSALLKGGQTVTVVLLSALIFCHHEQSQCLTRRKSSSLASVLSGMILYAISKKRDAYYSNDLKHDNNGNHDPYMKGIDATRVVHDKPDIESLLS